MQLLTNAVNEENKIEGFDQNKILEVKKKISNLKKEGGNQGKLNELLEELFPYSTIVSHEAYLSNVDIFLKKFVLANPKEYFYNLKSAILKQLKLIAENLINISSNARNIKRFLKKNEYLEEISQKVKALSQKYDEIASKIKEKLKKSKKLHNDAIYIWTEICKIKNMPYKVNSIDPELEKWDEINGLIQFIKDINEPQLRKRKKKLKEDVLVIHLNEIFEYFFEKQDGLMDAYADLTYLLFQLNVFEEFYGESFINVVERKEIVNQLNQKINIFLNSLVKDKLSNLIEYIEKKREFADKRHKEDSIIKEIDETKFTEVIPNLINKYFQELDKEFQSKLSKVSEHDPKDFSNLISEFKKKIKDLEGKVNDIDSWITNLDIVLYPYNNLLDPIKKSLSNLSMDLLRKSEEYQDYLNSVKDEALRLDIKNFVDERISQINKMISDYEYETSIIIREELPQLKRIRELLTEFKAKIESIKEEVYEKLDQYKDRNIDVYQIIKQWETNFNRKRHQLTFLFSIILNKIFKNFKDLIDKESILFAEITEITKQTENFEGLPMNFALSAFLANKLSEEELRERISEINAKIKHLTTSLGLYQVELAKLEEILANKVKSREGIVSSDVSCTVCHQQINFAKDKIITCPFCGSTYHYLCVADWLAKQNSCPMCLNNFLEPFSDLYDTNNE